MDDRRNAAGRPIPGGIRPMLRQALAQRS